MAEVKGSVGVNDNLTVDDNAKFQKGLDFPYLELIDEKTSGTAGGDFYRVEWQTRDFTTTIHNDFATSITLAPRAGDGAQFVIPAGVYHIEASAPAFNVDQHSARLADVTVSAGADGSTVFEGTAEFAADTNVWRDSFFYTVMAVATSGQTRSRLSGQFTATRTSTTLELQHICQAEQGTDGLGSDGGFYITNNIFSVLKMWQIDVGGTGPDRAHNAHQPFDGGAFSLNFSASTLNELDKEAATVMTMANSWTWMAWVKSDGGANAGPIFVLDGAGSDLHKFTHESNGTVWRASPAGATGSSKDYTWPSGSANVWRQGVAVHDVSEDKLLTYADGVEDTSPTVNFDGTLSITDIARTIHVGHNIGSADAYDGKIYQIAIWNSELTAAEVTAIFKGGDGRHMDLRVNSGDYISSANLQHWWRAGNSVSPNLGEDFGLDPIDLTDVVTLTDSDRSEDAPV